jgi:predicted 3-demethylubiquinone-9 3-methyltransferase (glyoxalase superfamily)
MGQKITPFLWFDNQAEEAMKLYVSVFKDSEVLNVSRYGEAGPGEPGSVMTASFRLNGQEFVALNGGPMFTFTEAVSFVIDCADQAEVDYYWNALTTGGGEPGACGWLKDRFGLSWQVVPKALNELIGGPDPEGAQRAMQAMLQMSKLDVAALQRAYDGR